jgi:hypothetical protein
MIISNRQSRRSISRGAVLALLLGTIAPISAPVSASFSAMKLTFVGAILNVDNAALGVDHINVRDQKGSHPEVQLRFPFTAGDHLAILQDIDRSGSDNRQTALLFPLAPASPAQQPLGQIASAPPAPEQPADEELFAEDAAAPKEPILGFFAGNKGPVVKRRTKTGWQLQSLVPEGDNSVFFPAQDNVDEFRGLAGARRLIATGGRLILQDEQSKTPLFDQDVKSFDLATDRNLIAIGYRGDKNDGHLCIKRLNEKANDPCLAEIKPELREMPAEPSIFADAPAEPTRLLRGVIYPSFSDSGRYLALIREIADQKGRGDLEIYDLQDATSPIRLATVHDVHFFDIRLFENPFSYPRSYSWVGDRIVFRPAAKNEVGKSRQFAFLDAGRCEDRCKPELVELPDCVVYDYPAFKEVVEARSKSVRMVQAADGISDCPKTARDQDYVELRIEDLGEVHVYRAGSANYLYAQVSLRSMNRLFNDSPGRKTPEPQTRVLIFRMEETP